MQSQFDQVLNDVIFSIRYGCQSEINGVFQNSGNNRFDMITDEMANIDYFNEQSMSFNDQNTGFSQENLSFNLKEILILNVFLDDDDANLLSNNTVKLKSLNDQHLRSFGQVILRTVPGDVYQRSDVVFPSGVEIISCPSIANCKVCSQNTCRLCKYGYYLINSLCELCQYPNLVYEHDCVAPQFTFQKNNSVIDPMSNLIVNDLTPLISTSQHLLMRIIQVLFYDLTQSSKVQENTFLVKN